jgi:hypothetical protein
VATHQKLYSLRFLALVIEQDFDSLLKQFSFFRTFDLPIGSLQAIDGRGKIEDLRSR